MDAETRKTLEAIAATTEQMGALGLEQPPRDAAAIRAALREVDALTQQVADLAHADECHAKFYARLCDALHVPEPHAVDGDVFDAIADLEARAIPKELLDTYAVDVECYREKRIEVRVDCRTNEVIRWSNPRAPSPTVTKFPTLSAALSAAKES